MKDLPNESFEQVALIDDPASIRRRYRRTLKNLALALDDFIGGAENNLDPAKA